ncbi:MAG: hypothetical protein AMJ65_10825 [Phycisphaerae bacterium SG8_4]|nr:MAG: hypothetical protein AMJ65_10825 [Phycisphaerae bacterium SG8_4]
MAHSNTDSRTTTELPAIPALRGLAYDDEMTLPQVARQIPAKFSGSREDSSQFGLSRGEPGGGIRGLFLFFRRR